MFIYYLVYISWEKRRYNKNTGLNLKTHPISHTSMLVSNEYR